MSRVTPSTRRRRWTGSLVAALLVASLVAVSTATAADPGGSTGGVLPPSAGQSKLIQDPTWVALKNANRISRLGSGEVVVLPAPMAVPAVATASLSTSVTARIVESQGNLYDDLHHALTDSNYWNFCTAGGSDVALYYFKPGNVTGWAPGYFSEPYGPHVSTTYWANSDTGTSSDTSNGYATKGRAYLMYLAEQVRPPSYSTPGILNFSSYPTTGGSITDVRDALNWEASSHGSNWSTYFYIWRGTSGLSQATLLANVTWDIAAGAATVVDLNTYVSSTYHLPNWTRNVGHTVAIVGYNNTAGTYTYLDTCGVACGSTSNGGTHAVAQSTMYQLIMNLGYGYDW